MEWNLIYFDFFFLLLITLFFFWMRHPTNLIKYNSDVAIFYHYVFQNNLIFFCMLRQVRWGMLKFFFYDWMSFLLPTITCFQVFGYFPLNIESRQCLLTAIMWYRSKDVCACSPILCGTLSMSSIHVSEFGWWKLTKTRHMCLFLASNTAEQLLLVFLHPCNLIIWQKETNTTSIKL